MATFVTDPRFKHRQRELRTMTIMVRMYCREHHGGGTSPCPDCAALLDYATRRLRRCVFGDAKPTCSNCTVHCYSENPREAMRALMRWAGPRMLLRHPLLAILHLIDGRRPTPKLPHRR